MDDIVIEDLSGKFYSPKQAANDLRVGQIIIFKGALNVIRGVSNYAYYDGLDIVTLDEFVKNRSYWESSKDSSLILLGGGDDV